MAKIHTHYDNLKVARGAPQEVIRAAYKALSQKYHPDKNPGDEKAARIMAIVNSAYNTLSDPVRRREHDEWIAAEEWEVEWLESTREEGQPRGDAGAAWDSPPMEVPPPYRVLRDPRLWMAGALSLSVGIVIGLVIMAQPRLLPAEVAGALNFQSPVAAAVAPAKAALSGTPARPATEPDPWAVEPAPAGPVAPPQVKALAVTELIVPLRAPDCEMELHTLVAPNGDPWPPRSSYLDGYPIGNQGHEMRFEINNEDNSSPVLVKIYDLERRSNVRHAYVLGQDRFVIDKLAAGKYEVRYQNIEVGGSKADCMARRQRAQLAERVD
jgi:hypothetical protein